MFPGEISGLVLAILSFRCLDHHIEIHFQTVENNDLK